MIDFDYHEKGRLLLHNRKERKMVGSQVPTSLKENMIIRSECLSFTDRQIEK